MLPDGARHHFTVRVQLTSGGDGQSDEGVFDPGPGIKAELLAGGGEAGEYVVAQRVFRGSFWLGLSLRAR